MCYRDVVGGHVAPGFILPLYHRSRRIVEDVGAESEYLFEKNRWTSGIDRAKPGSGGTVTPLLYLVYIQMLMFFRFY